MDVYPEDFSHPSPLLEHLSALQEVMASSQDMELLELVSSDSLLVLITNKGGFHLSYTFLLSYPIFYVSNIWHHKSVGQVM